MYSVFSHKGYKARKKGDYMKKNTKQWLRKAASVGLAFSLVLASVPAGIIPARVVQAAPGNLETGSILSAQYVKDPTVLKYYTILANAQEKYTDTEDPTVIEELSRLTASQVIDQYGSNSDYTGSVYMAYLNAYAGDIDFGDLTITSMEGIGWARKAKNMNLEGLKLTSGEITEIPDSEFNACTGLEQITFPETLKKIGKNAFSGCTSLKSLSVGKAAVMGIKLQNVGEIGEAAFSGCTSVENVELGDSEDKVMGSYAFTGCTSLKAIDIPMKDADKIGASAFEGCTKLTEVTLKEGIQYISSALFKGCAAEAENGMTFRVKGDNTSNILPKSVQVIRSNAFQEAKLDKIDLTNCDKMTEIGDYGFALAAIAEIKLPENLKKLDAYAFQGAVLTSIDIPSNCTEWGEGVFSQSSLTKISLPKTLEVIPQRSFRQCQFLMGDNIQIEDGSNLETIGENAFEGCILLANTNFLKGLTKLRAIKAGAFQKCYSFFKRGTSYTQDIYGSYRLRHGGDYGPLETVELPDCVTELGEQAFADNYGLKTVDLGEGIESIPEKAFYNANAGNAYGAKLEKVIVSSKLTSIGKYAFQNQTRLNTIGYGDTVKNGTAQFPSTLGEVGDYAFAGCATEATVNGYTVYPFYVKKAGMSDTEKDGYAEYAVVEEDKSSTKTVYIAEDDRISSLDYAGLSETEQLQYTKVLAVAVRCYYKAADVVENSVSGTTYKVADEYLDTTTDAYKTYYYRQESTQPTLRLKSGTILEKNKDSNMESQMFMLTTSILGLQSSTAGSVTYAFGLQKVILPDSVAARGIGAHAFENCFNLTTVRLPKGLKEIKEYTFSGCGKKFADNQKADDFYGLRTAVIPDTVTSIGKNAFSKCYNLVLTDEKGMGSTFGLSVQTIGDYAFDNCPSLEEIIFPSSLTTIGNNAFSNSTIKEKVQTSVTYQNTSGKEIKYTYYRNRKPYGTYSSKTGLTSIDFDRAIRLESIGTNAFQNTNVVKADMSKTKIQKLPTGAFSGCTYLANVKVSDTTEDIASKVFVDNEDLKNINIPLAATLNGQAIYGSYGTTAGKDINPTLQFDNSANTSVTVPIQGSVTLPIRVLNSDTLNGVPTVTLIDNEGTSHALYKDGQSVEGGYEGLTVKVSQDEKTGVYSFTLSGTSYIKEAVKVRVEFQSKFRVLESNGFMINSHTVDYAVRVVDMPTEAVDISAAEDTVVKNKPTMYEETSGGKILYIPSTGQAATSGIQVKAVLTPYNTTEGVIWETSDPSVVTIGEPVTKDGVSTATIKRIANGKATITVTSGSKTDTLDVYCQTAAKSLKVTTVGDNLPGEFSSASGGTSKGSPYMIKADNGGKDAIRVTPEFDSSYDGVSGEKVVYTSSNPDIIEVDNTGKITTKGAADEVVTITATAQASGQKKDFFLKVQSDVTLSVATITICGKNGANTVGAGSTLQMEADVRPAAATNKKVTWSITSGAAYGSIDENGLLTAKDKGSIQIQAVSENGKIKSNKYIVKVTMPSSELKIYNTNPTVKVGSELRINKTTSKTASTGFIILPTNSDDTVTWTTDRPDLVNVSYDTSKVVIKGLAAGKATITGTTTSGVKASVEVTVLGQGQSADGSSQNGSGNNGNGNNGNGSNGAYSNGSQIPATGIRIFAKKPNAKKMRVAKGSSTKVKVVLTPASTTDKVTYRSLKNAVATVSASGVIKAKKNGTAKIEITTTSGRRQVITVIVSKKVKAKKVKVKAPKTMKRKKTATLKVSLAPAKSTDTLSFKSSKSSVVKVDGYGVLTAKKKGTAKITVKASSGKKKVIKIKVK